MCDTLCGYKMCWKDLNPLSDIIKRCLDWAPRRTGNNTWNVIWFSQWLCVAWQFSARLLSPPSGRRTPPRGTWTPRRGRRGGGRCPSRSWPGGTSSGASLLPPSAASDTPLSEEVHMEHRLHRAGVWRRRNQTLLSLRSSGSHGTR